MHIVYFADSVEIGGAERNLADMAQAALDAGHRVTVLAPQTEVLDFVRRQAPRIGTERAASDDYRHASTSARRTVALAREVAGLRRTLGALGADLLHVNNGGFPGSDLCRIAPLSARLAGMRSRLMSIHSVPWSRGIGAAGSVQRGADQLVWRTTDAVICTCRAIASALAVERAMPAELGRVVYCGTHEPTPDTVAAAPELRRCLSPDGSPLVAMVSSSASPAKGFDVFLDALAVTAGMRGVIVGPDPGAMITDRIARLGLRERVVLTGRIETVGAIYGAIDALVVPSTRYESTTLVALEAMAASRPVIASRLSGIPEVVADGRTGRLFAPGDVVGLAGLLADLATAPGAWRAMGEAGRRRWEAAFTLPRMAGALLTVYDELVGPK